MDLNDLRTRLTFTFIVLSALPLAAFGLYSYIKGVEMVRDKAVSHLESVVDKDVGMINRFVTERMGDLSLFASTLEDNVSAASVRKRLISLQESYDVYEGMLLVDINGQTIVRVGKVKALSSPPPRDEWLQKTLSGGIFVGEYLTRRDSGEGVFILFAVPVIDRSRNIRSVLVAYVSTKFLNNILKETHIGKTGEVYVLNKEGYFLTTTRIGGQTAGQRAVSEESKKYFHEVGRKEYIDYRGVRVIRASQRIPGQDWIVIGEQDSDEAFQEINALRLSTIIFIAALIVLTSVVGHIVSSVVVRLLETAYRHRKELELQIIQKDKLASMGLLTAGIAHEINTPLANALLYSQLLKEDVQKIWPEHLQKIAYIEEEIRRGSNIVRSLLEFSRQSRLETNEVDVNDIVTRLLDIAESQCADRAIQIKRSLSRDLPMVRGDASVLYQVFMNIVANAVEAMESGGILGIATRYIPALRKVKVEFQDTGPGIPNEVIGKVFDPFFTTKKVGEGTGLGLAMSHGVVKKMGGNIRVMSICRDERDESAGPTGTTFVIELPVAEMAENSRQGA
jgi:two-component system NtrC family sensor kinase